MTRGPQEAALFDAMRSFRFPVMGFERSYWDFYRGFALVISLLLLVLAAIAWQLSAMSRTDARRALPLAISLEVGCVGLLALSVGFFFGAPIVLAAIAAGCSSAALGMLVREGRMRSTLPGEREIRSAPTPAS